MAYQIVFNPIENSFDLVGSGGGPAPSSPRYTQSFVSADWILDSPDYKLTVLASTHSVGTSPAVHVYELISGDYEQVTSNIVVNPSGDVTVRVASAPDNRFNGLILIL